MGVRSAVLVAAFAAVFTLCAAAEPEAPNFGYDAADVEAFVSSELHAPIELNDANFADTVVHGGLDGTAPEDFLVFFYAPWCGHCKATKPIFAQAAEALRRVSVEDSARHYKVKGHPKRFAARFALVDATANPVVAKAFRVRSYPTFFHFHKGQAFKYTGGRDAESFVFFARFVGFARHHSPLVPQQPAASGIFSVQQLAPQRALFVMSPGCKLDASANQDDRARVGEPLPGGALLRPACFAVAMALASNNKIHFVVADGAVEEVFGESKAGAIDGPARVKHCDKIRRAFAEASKGPHGEAIVALTDMYDDFGAIPFMGDWTVSPMVPEPGASDDEQKSALVADLWSTAVPRAPRAVMAWAGKVGGLPVGDSDPGSLQASFEHDGGNGLIGLLMVPTAPAEKNARALLRSLAQRRNRFELVRSGGSITADPSASSGGSVSAPTTAAAPAATKGGGPSDDDLVGNVVDDADIDTALEAAEVAMDVGTPAKSPSAATDTPGNMAGSDATTDPLAAYLQETAAEDERAEALALDAFNNNASFLDRRKVVTLHAVTASPEFAADFGTSLAEMPVFTVYWPRHQMVCHTRVPADAVLVNALDDDKPAAVEALRLVRRGLAAADAGDMSGCVGRDWPATIVYTLLTRPFPSLDGTVRGTGMGNLELVMVGGCFILILALIPLAVFRGGDDDAERQRRGQMQQRARLQRAGAAGAAAAAVLRE